MVRQSFTWIREKKGFRICSLNGEVAPHQGGRSSRVLISYHLICPLTVRVTGTPQMILQPVSSIFPLFSTALWDLANSRPVHFLMLSSHLFLCLPCLLPPFTLPCKTVLARPDECQTCPYHCSLCLTMVKRSFCGLTAPRW